MCTIPKSITEKLEVLSSPRGVRFVFKRLTEEDQKFVFDNFGDINTLFWLWFWNGKKETFPVPRCATCGKVLDIKKSVSNNGIRKYCCRTCCANNEERRIRAHKTLEENPEKKKRHVDSERRKDILENVKKTNLEKYGVEFPFQSAIYREKAKESIKERYGVDNIAQSLEFLNKRIKSKRECEFENYSQNMIKLHSVQLLSTKEEFVNSDTLKFKCILCGKEWEQDRKVAQQVFCTNCFSERWRSRGEKELFQFIKDNVSCDVLNNVRGLIDHNKEIDIFIPSMKLAFEFDGDYWHSSEYRGKYYHIEKTKKLNEKDIRLIHINESEWFYNNVKIKGFILGVLGKYNKRIFARKCSVRKLDSKTFRQFLEENHLGTPINASTRLGLFASDNELVSVIGIGKSRYKKDEYEIYRFCNKLGYSVVGGLSKLVKHSGLNDLVSYVDLAKFDGHGYLSSGFELVGETEPNYYYSDGKRTIDRISAQKHKLEKLLGEGYDPTLNEEDNMRKNGFFKIFNCGNLKLKQRNKRKRTILHSQNF